MKTPEEVMAIFAAMPAKKKVNPFWSYAWDEKENGNMLRIVDSYGGKLCFNETRKTLRKVRDFFRLFYESFKTEAQVLCISDKDAKKLKDIGVPVLTTGQIGPYGVTVFVLPQDNHMGTTVVSEGFWQKYIVGNDITPVARIHSHHVLDPYQSGTDYSTLNSGSLEIVLGDIFDEPLAMCYWLDVLGTDIKANTFVAQEDIDNGVFATVPWQFNGKRYTVPDISITYEDMCQYGYNRENMYPIRKETAFDLMDKGNVTVFLLYEDGTEAEAETSCQIAAHAGTGGIFGVRKKEWESIQSAFNRKMFLNSLAGEKPVQSN